MTGDVLSQMEDARFLMEREGMNAGAASAATGLPLEMAQTLEIDAAQSRTDCSSRQFDAYVESHVEQRYQTWAQESHDAELDRVDQMITELARRP